MILPLNRYSSASGLLAPVAMIALLAIGAPAQARPALCDNPSDLGYAAGAAGKKPPEAALKQCPKEAATYRSAYRAGAYVRSLDRSFGGAAANTAPAPALSGASSGAFSKAGSRDAGTRATLRRSRCGVGSGRAAGVAGAPYPSGCGPSAGAAQGYRQGQALRRAQSQAARSSMEKSRLNTRLLSPSLSTGERRLIENRLRTINRREGLRRIQDPLLR